MPRFFLLDGTALAYRSHFAFSRSGLTAPDGRPTGATYGFTTALRRIIQNEAPERIVVALDAKGPTFRHKRYADYKATRQRAPEEMISQLEDVRRVVRAHGVSLFEIPGYEADDVIGTLATQALKANYEVMIATGDKDLMQLVGPNLTLYNFFKTNVDLVLEDEAAVQAKFGTDPAHVVDVLALMGDKSDNIPGVDGIGEKGAGKLIQQFGSVPALLERLDQVKGKVKEYIERDREQLLMSLELVKIDCEVPLDPGFESITEHQADPRVLKETFEELGFTSLLKQITERLPKDARDDVLIQDRAGLESMMDELRSAGRYAFDTETTSLFPLQADLVGMSFSARTGRAFYVPCNANPPVIEGGTQALLEALQPLLCDPSVPRTGQNSKYDDLVLKAQGMDLPPPAFDTMVASFTVHGSTRRHGLDELALSYFGINKIPTKDLIGTGAKQITMAEVDIATVSEYACEDAEVTWRLREELERELEETGSETLYYDLEMPLVPVLTAMETRGIRLDVPLLDELSVELQADIETAQEQVHRAAGCEFKLGSHKELGRILFEELEIQKEAGVKRPKKTKTGWATDHDTLRHSYSGVEVVEALLTWRELTKLKNTYVDTLPSYVHPLTGRVHCSFSQTTAATGRLASSDPNLQNIPVRTERGRRLREAFIAGVPYQPGRLVFRDLSAEAAAAAVAEPSGQAELFGDPKQPKSQVNAAPSAEEAARVASQEGASDWVLLAADYSQVELRLMAHMSGDELMQAAFAEGKDIHASTAATVFGVDPDEVSREMRSRAKAVNFGLLYGMGSQRLARETGMTTTEAKEFIERYFGAFPKVREWKELLLEHVRASGHVETLFGRRRPIPEINSKAPRARAMAENTAVNTPIQGSAADIIKRAMIDLERRLGESSLKGQMLLQVHDELLLELPRSEVEATRDLVRDCMENAVVLDVPLQVDFGVGVNWLEAH